MNKYHEIVKRHREERKNLDMESLFPLLIEHKKEIRKEIEKDKAGNGFIVDMFRYTMNDTEYHINEYKHELLDYLDIKEEEFEGSEALQRGFESARSLYMKGIEKYFYL